MAEVPRVRTARKAAKQTPKLLAARTQGGEVFKKAWAKAKGEGRRKPTASDISAARVELGLSAKGTSTH